PGEADPLPSDPLDVIADRAGDDPTVRLVSINRLGVSSPELSGGVGLPRLDEAVDARELMDSAGGAQLGEEATPAHRLELAWVADQHDAPAFLPGQMHEPIERRGADHARPIHHPPRPRPPAAGVRTG